jgi:hypothetical protein
LRSEIPEWRRKVGQGAGAPVQIVARHDSDGPLVVDTGTATQPIQRSWRRNRDPRPPLHMKVVVHKIARDHAAVSPPDPKVCAQSDSSIVTGTWSDGRGPAARVAEHV